MTESATMSEETPMSEKTPMSEPTTSAEPSAPQPSPQTRASSASGPSGSAWEARQPFDPTRKSPRLAAILSLVPGLGQAYVGYYQRAAAVISSLIALIAIANHVPSDIAPAFGFGAAFLWVFNIVDAGRIAALYNHAAAGSTTFELPQDLDLPATSGALTGGVVLVLFGVIALSNTAFGWSLMWLETWWPIFPLGFGAYLIYRGVKDRS